ncbi:Gfo/Idh/MocA family protein [Saliterribacillus persicus]|uniref:Putative dehydrogenase n=1 Tax=Saliterribacillus persicus TaxID=930114 RepID=A0A368XDQ7_9BACI|nr:Gfo/Idh/MocA family oxidoreductase [Saliterribacillus persicus]RCW65799.1 putative dehydrogenase [Saliterribacillus persicus]
MVRFGVIGTNWITDHFIDGASHVEDFSLTAVYSRTQEKADEFSSKHNGLDTYTEVEAFANATNVDAVYIASPTSLHKDYAISCMKKGKHVIVEKPMASNQKEVAEMIQVAKDEDVLLMEAMKTTHLPNFDRIQTHLETIAPIRRYVANFCQYSSRYDKYKAGTVLNAFKPEFSNGATMDIGVYCIYPMVALFGAPNSVKGSAYMLESGVDGQGAMTADYDEMNGVAMYSKITSSNVPSEIQGENGSLVIEAISDVAKVTLVRKDGSKEDITVQQHENTMYYEAKAFIELIKNGEKECQINSHANSLETMKVLDKVRQDIGVTFPADK